jgi:hypothetical protein
MISQWTHEAYFRYSIKAFQNASGIILTAQCVDGTAEAQEGQAKQLGSDKAGFNPGRLLSSCSLTYFQGAEQARWPLSDSVSSSVQ